MRRGEGGGWGERRKSDAEDQEGERERQK